MHCMRLLNSISYIHFKKIMKQGLTKKKKKKIELCLSANIPYCYNAEKYHMHWKGFLFISNMSNYCVIQTRLYLKQFINFPFCSATYRKSRMHQKS